MANTASARIADLKPGDGYVQSFARGLEVIRSFSAKAPSQTLTEVAGRAGLGYVRSDGKLFSLSPRILDLGFSYLSSMPIWNLAEPVMEALVAQVHESSSAAVLDGTDIVYVLRVPTRKIMSISLGVGSRLPAYCTSMGRMLLSALAQDDLMALLRASDLAARTKTTLTDAKEIAAKVAQARRQGWSLVNQELEEGLISLAAPIVDRSGQMVAALNISGQANRTSARVMQDTMLEPLLEAARTISRQLDGTTVD